MRGFFSLTLDEYYKKREEKHKRVFLIHIYQISEELV